MKIKIDEIPEEGLSLELSEDGSALVTAEDVLEFALEGKVLAHLNVSKVSGLVYVEGNLRAKTITECLRCLKPISSELSLRIDEKLLLCADGAGGGEGKERELSFHDMDYTVMEAAELDTNDILLEQIVLGAEERALCNEDCAGLCYSCGKDLNKDACGCVSSDNKEQEEDEPIDKRFEKLKDFKLK